VTDADKNPEQIERDMERTRESITEKVSALETQVMGTIQTATNTVTETVAAVKEAVTGAPAAMRDTVQQTVAAVKDTVKETVESFSVSGCVRNNPLAAVGTSLAGGFLLGYLLPSPRSWGPLMARGSETPAPRGRTLAEHSEYTAPAAVRREPAAPGFLDGLLTRVGDELRQVAEQALSTGLASLKQSISTQVPQVVDAAVHTMTDKVAGAVAPDPDATTRVGGPNYAATAPGRRF
jgi:ElaB/YqjD/DUF883 family membrane-anchored ribosome-binding protein